MTEFSQNSPLPAAMTGPDAPIRVALILSSRLERLGWGIVISGQADMHIVGEFSSVAPARAFLAREPVDVVLVDEAVLTPKTLAAIRSPAGAGPGVLVIAQHPVEGPPADADAPLPSRYLLKGVSGADLVAAIRKLASAQAD
ncbi:MAG TPA: hypothetical protein VME68_15955 [Acidobacteriaceae bacterium]|nr:hypothetical protein [Acidobacteriaceae bacterium]